MSVHAIPSELGLQPIFSFSSRAGHKELNWAASPQSGSRGDFAAERDGNRCVKQEARLRS